MPGEKNFFQTFGEAFAKGDIFTKVSFLVWGLGYIGHGQLMKALLVTLVEGLGALLPGPGQVIPRDKRIRRNALRQRKKRIRACFNRLPLLSEAVEAEQIYHIIWNRHLQIVIFSL